MKKRIWKKYNKCGNRHSLETTSYDELYNDLQDSNKNWNIAQDYEWCKDHLCGELVPCYNIKPGDIYVYYEIENNNSNPIFYLKVEEYIDHDTKEHKNHIEINGSSISCVDIEETYIPLIIQKLEEIDKIKNQYYIKALNEKYNDYIKLLNIIDKTKLTEEDILFLYHMACIKKHEIAISKIKERNITEDYNKLTTANKVKLFLEIQKDEICDSLIVTDKSILKLIAQNKCLRFFKNTTDEIINDKELVKSLLLEFFNADMAKTNDNEITNYLPTIYRTDLEMLEFIFYNYTTALTLRIAKWLEKSENIDSLRKNKQFATKLIDSFSRALISRNQIYYNNCLPWLFDNETIENLDSHVLIGPEPSEEKERLKEVSIKTLRKNIKETINYNN